ncbi:FecCD family ABC transporter permease [Natronobacterium gregoryi]|uniref:Cobalamin import system permease protein BtuC n=2 Tax=Natronobacterium gregoryi TaxID=44930 RepID=L0AGR5_NATGS|nr:ABC-type Fe3+-siderophore transport system, permease component [Natronobacterium gregoryi SP2]SFJ67702.1 iron complex transport system permease protein [Natronobacterium gregoryi]
MSEKTGQSGPRSPTATTADRQVGSGGRLEWVDGPLLSVCLASLAITVVAGAVQITFGDYSVSITEVWGIVFDPAVLASPSTLYALVFGGELAHLPTESLIVWTQRVPRVLVAVFVGMNLAISGAIFQAVTRNELASPYILGVSSGAGLAVLLTLVVFGGLAAYLPLFAALGGAFAFLLVYAIAWNGGTSPVRLVLAGVIVSTVFGSVQTGLYFFVDDLGTVQEALAWTTGTLSGAGWSEIRLIVPWTVLTVSLSIVGARQLNVLLLGERTARSLGMSVERARFSLSAVAIVAASASVAVSGIIGFVGLIVPHMVRTIVGSDYRPLIVGCLFVGPALLVVADVCARLAISGSQLPVGILTGLIGGPYFLYLMKRKQHLGEL